jgi:hypothetical protein
MSSVGPSPKQLEFILSEQEIRSLLDSKTPFDVNQAVKKARGWKDYVGRFDPLFVLFFMVMTEAPKLKSEQITIKGVSREQVVHMYNECVKQLTPVQRSYLGNTTTLPDHSTIGGYVLGRVFQLYNIIYGMWHTLPVPSATCPTTTTTTCPTTNESNTELPFVEL